MVKEKMEFMFPFEYVKILTVLNDVCVELFVIRKFQQRPQED